LGAQWRSNEDISYLNKYIHIYRYRIVFLTKMHILNVYFNIKNLYTYNMCNNMYVFTIRIVFLAKMHILNVYFNVKNLYTHNM